MANKTNRNTPNTVVVVQLREGSWQWLLNDHQGNCVIAGETYGSRKACMLGAKRVGLRMHKWVTSMGWVDSNSAPQQVDAKRQVNSAPLDKDIQLLALAMHSKTFKSPSDRELIIKKWLETSIKDNQVVYVAQQVDARREVDPAPQPRRGLFGMRRG